MTAEFLSEAAAWRRIAERIDAGRHFGKRGLCAEIIGLYDAHAIDLATYRVMDDRIHHYNGYDATRCYPGKGGPYFYPPGEDWDSRLLCALWFALEAEDDAKARSLQSSRGSQK